MKYALGIDVGTSYTAAAIWRPDSRQHTKAEVVPLGAHTPSVASILFLGADGSVVVGEFAQRRALTDPDRVVREFKRRIGDDTPLFVGEEPYQAHELAAQMVCWVVDRVAEREGGRPDQIAITHPAAWGPYKKDLLRTALSARGLSNLTFLSEPEAAAISYASMERVEPDSTIAVYDLGGGTFDAAVVRKTSAGGFTLLGTPEGLEQLGGADFDEAVFNHVRTALGAQLEELDFDDPGVLSGLARLRRECTEAKEALSSDTEVSVPVLLPGVNSQVRLVRSEFEDMVRPALEETVEALTRAIASADLTSDDLGAVLLVGGSSRMPLVAQIVSAELGCPVVVDADPKTTIALGAALSLVPPTERPTETLAAVPPVMAPGPEQVALAAHHGDIDHQDDAYQPQSPFPDQIPERPPMLGAQSGFLTDSDSDDERFSRRKLAVGALFSVILVGLVTGALLIPTLTAEQTGSTRADAGNSAPIRGDSGFGGLGGSTGADEKVSAAGDVLARGREDSPEQTPGQANAPTTTTAKASPTPAPVGRATPPPAPAPSQGGGNATHEPAPPADGGQPPATQPPPTQEPPPPTTQEPPPPTTHEPPPPTTQEPPPPTTEEPPPTSDPPPAGPEE